MWSVFPIVFRIKGTGIKRTAQTGRKTIVALFDYTDRDPLDHQAKVTWIMEDEDAGLCSH